MKTRKLIILIFYPVLLLVLDGCAELQPQVAASGGAGTERTIVMKASSFEFRPNNIQADQGETLVFTITNVSGAEHNFTITDPQGRTLKSVDLPENETLAVTVKLDKPGTYEFYCDKPFHATFGMKGQVTATAAEPM